MSRGYLIAFEGIDGSGKTTQVEMLARALSSLGHRVICAREPGGTGLGESIRALLLSTCGPQISPRAEAMLYAAARAQLVHEQLGPALGAGAIILMDRFTDSTVAYQGYGRGLPMAPLKELNIIATGGILPDLTILLDLDPKLARCRIKDKTDRPDRLEMAGTDFFRSVRQGYLDMAAGGPGRYLVLDAVLPKEELHVIIYQNVNKLLAFSQGAF